jgi:isopropylmalate/homocitrate/citramalate synthase
MPIHFHGHNDFGMATASAVAAVRAGASWIQGTINGMGERAGNADIAEVALALQCVYDVPVELNLGKAREVSETVRRLAGYQLEPWKPVVGETLFMRESGAVATQFHIPEAIEPYSSELVQAKRELVLGKKSGIDSIDIKAKELGLQVPEERRGALLAAVKQKSIEKRGLVSDDEFRDMVRRLGS